MNDILKRGASGDAVRRWQTFLKSRGLVVGAIDGDFGESTERATRTFQRFAGIEVDGEVGPATLREARERGFTTPADRPPATGGTTTPIPVAPVPVTPALKSGGSGDVVRRWQNFLKSRGLVEVGALDGDFGPSSVFATRRFQMFAGLKQTGLVDADTLREAQERGFQLNIDPAPRPFDARTERLIKTLLPKAQPLARRFLTAVRDTGIDARIISGSRTYAEQNDLYAQGRTKTGRIVTNARGGYSNHNFGIAWDIGIFGANGNYLEESSAYERAGAIGRSLGLDWGGDWARLKDTPHYEVKTGFTLAEKRTRVAAGQPIL